ncbi:MAG: hypothetical protein ACTSU5_11210 [Promethearchaeota archaeon]
MKTYLIVFHSSEGQNPLEVMQKLTGMGFKPMKGYYDYEYDHGSSVEIDDILDFGIRVHETLRGTGVQYKLETVNLDD